MNFNFNDSMTASALALWQSKEPEKALEQIGFQSVEKSALVQGEHCIIVDLLSSTIGVGVFQSAERHLICQYYSELREDRSGESEVALRVQIPNAEGNLRVLKLS